MQQIFREMGYQVDGMVDERRAPALTFQIEPTDLGDRA